MPPVSGRVVGNWIIEQPIGSGSFAVVWKARHVATGAPAAIKEISTDKLNRKLQESLLSEIAVLERTKHNNIVCLLDLYKEPGKIFLVLEYCGGGDLGHYLRRYGACSEAAARHLLQQLVEGLKTLRLHNVIHRDLKPQNLLLSDPGSLPSLKIADFGFARPLQPQGLAETLCGSPLYMAPEILKLHKYDAKADLWSVGAILFELLVGKPPFNGANHLQLVQNIEGGEAVIPESVARRLSPQCRQLVHQLLRRNPVERISFEELFAHPFLVAGPAAADDDASSSASSAQGSSVPNGLLGTTPPYAQPQPHQHAQALPWQPGIAPGGAMPVSTGAVRVVRAAGAAAGMAAAGPMGRQHAPAAPAATQGSGRPQWQHNGVGKGAEQDPEQQRADGGAAGASGANGGSGPLAAAASNAVAAVMAADAAGGHASPPLLPIHVRELTRSPSPRLTAAAVAVATALQGSSMAAAAAQQHSTGPHGPTAAAAAASGSAGATAKAGTGLGCLTSASLDDGMTKVSLDEPGDVLADSIEDEFVIVSSPHCPASSPTHGQAAPRQAKAGPSGRPASQVASAAHQGQRRPGITAAAPGATPALGVPGSAAVYGGGPTLQPLPPAGRNTAPPPSIAATMSPAPAPLGHYISQRQAPGSSPGGLYGALVMPPTSMVVRLPQQLDTADLLQRVVQLLLDSARSRADALLDLEAEERGLAGAGPAGAASGLVGGAAVVSEGALAGPHGHTGAAYGGCDAAAGVRLAEAAAVVGSLLAACRLLEAALGGSEGRCHEAAMLHNLSPWPASGCSGGGGGGGQGTWGPQQRWGAHEPSAEQVEPTAAQHQQPGNAAPAAVSSAMRTTAGVGQGQGQGHAAIADSASPPQQRHQAGPQHALLVAHARALLALVEDKVQGGLMQVLSGNEAVPSAINALLEAAVRYSRAAAGEELLGNSRAAVEQYARASDLLLFLLAEVPEVPQRIKPPLPQAEHSRVYKYYAAVRLRQSSCMAALNAAAGMAAPPR